MTAHDIAKEPTDRFEELAAAFQRATGMMAPGKSVPAAMASDEHESERQRRWVQWLKDTSPPPLSAVPDEEPTRHSPSSNDDLTINCPKCGYTQTLGELRASHRCGNCGHPTRSVAQLKEMERRAQLDDLRGSVMQRDGEIASLQAELSSLRSESEALRRDKALLDEWAVWANALRDPMAMAYDGATTRAVILNKLRERYDASQAPTASPDTDPSSVVKDVSSGDLPCSTLGIEGTNT